MSIHPSRAAEIVAEKQRMTFAFGDVKSGLLKAFRTNRYAYLYEETADGSHFATFDTEQDAVWDDIMGGSFKVGDNLNCQLREGKTEVFFQLKFKKSITNIYDPERYIQPDKVDDKPHLHFFVKPTGITILAFSETELNFDKCFKLLKKEAKAVIRYDENDYAVMKKTAPKNKIAEGAWGFDFG